MNRYNIGEISKLFGISKQALRYYDKINLIKPKYTDQKTGYRYYEYSQFHKLGLIISLKQTGVSLELIKSYIELKDISLLKEILINQEEQLMIQLESIQNMKKFTSNLIENIIMIEDFKYKDKEGIFGTKKIEKRDIIKIDIDFKISELYSCIKLINQLIIISNKVHGRFKKRDILLSITKENLLNERFDVYNSIGTFIHYNSQSKTNAGNFFIEANNFAYTYHFGSYNSISETYKKLYDYIYEQDFEIVGSSVEIGRLNISHTDNTEDFITEIQIPIK